MERKYTPLDAWMADCLPSLAHTSVSEPFTSPLFVESLRRLRHKVQCDTLCSCPPPGPCLPSKEEVDRWFYNTPLEGTSPRHLALLAIHTRQMPSLHPRAPPFPFPAGTFGPLPLVSTVYILFSIYIPLVSRLVSASPRSSRPTLARRPPPLGTPQRRPPLPHLGGTHRPRIHCHPGKEYARQHPSSPRARDQQGGPLFGLYISFLSDCFQPSFHTHL